MTTLGVVGAGTMGAGIAQLGAAAGIRTLLWDPDAEALARATEAPVERADGLDDLAACDVVIEAAPEDLALKQGLFTELAAHVRSDCVMATNTSSLLVTAVAASVPQPERVVGLHFFNPPAKMRLIELVAGERSGGDALRRGRELGEAMGKTVIDAADGPGFIVNRCNRPFGLEALRAVEEGQASITQVDRIARLAGGFRMGPFALQDLVGIDVGFSVSRSFFTQSFGEPRWRPSMLAARKAASGDLGRKTGRGWFAYPDGAPPDPEPPAAGRGDGLLVVTGDYEIAEELRDLAGAAGWDVAPDTEEGEVPFLILECGDEGVPAQGGPRAVLCAEGSLAALDPGGGSAGFHALPPFGAARVVEATRGPYTSLLALERTEHVFGTLGKTVEWVGDGPGLVLGRIVAQLVNEAAFAVRAGVGSEAAVDDGLTLGLNHPRGPFAWDELMGRDHVLAILDGLWEERREEAYRACPTLRRLA